MAMMRRKMSMFPGALLPLVLLAACGGDERSPGAPSGPIRGLAVNSFLWRATLETLVFMPMVEVDPASGTIITDWYVNPDVPTERMKVTVFIIGAVLRADALKVTVIREEREPNGVWVNRPVRAGTQLQIEDAILAKARQLRIDSIES